MDYEKKYKAMLEQARDYHSRCQTEEAKRELEAIIPELRESEDDRIRKEIIGYLNSRVPTAEETELLYFKRWIAWLEKQKEQKPADDNPLDDPRFMEGFDAGRSVQKIFDEPKPAWSEEDEMIRKAILGFLNPDKGGTKYS